MPAARRLRAQADLDAAVQGLGEAKRGAQQAEGQLDALRRAAGEAQAGAEQARRELAAAEQRLQVEQVRCRTLTSLPPLPAACTGLAPATKCGLSCAAGAGQGCVH